MAEKQEFHFFDLLDFIIKRKELIVIVFFFSLVITYLGIYFLVEEQFEATAVIIPREDDAAGLAGNILSSMKKLPLGLGPKSSGSDMDLYKTIIFSRTMMEDVVRKFDLFRIYKLDTTNIGCMEVAVKRLRSEVGTKESEESALLITVRANTRQRAADMTNFVVSRMNDRIIELKVSRSRENRIFLEKRVDEISKQLRAAEDSLRAFQERTGFLDAKTQLQGILTANATIENELIAKKIQLGILERLYDKQSQQVQELDAQIEEFQKKLGQLRTQGDPGSPFLPLKKLPKTTSEFLRYYREVELNNLLMEFVVPLYEQAKIEEKKDYPVLQVIDYAVPPARKSYPPRTILSLIGALSITIFILFVLKLRDRVTSLSNPRLISIFKEMKSWNYRFK